MITGKISLAVCFEHSGHCEFGVEVSRPLLHTHSNFWEDRDALAAFGAELLAFPKTAEDKVRFEVGKPEYQHDDYLLLEAFCYSPAGHAAIRVCAHNGKAEPYRQRLEFSIPAEVASINKLGKLLLSWEMKENSSVEWEAEAG